MSWYSIPNILEVKERSINGMRGAHDRLLELIKYRRMHELGHPITEAILSPDDTELIDYVRRRTRYGENQSYMSFMVFINKLIKEKEEEIDSRLRSIKYIDRFIAGTNDPAAN